MNAGKPDEAGYLFAVITLLIWSSFVIVSRMGGKSDLTPYDITALRIGTAAAVLSPWWLPRLLRPSLRRLALHQSLLFAALAGICYPLLAYGGFQHAPASHGAVLISGMLPLFTSLFAYFMLGERPTLARVLSMLLIVGGVATLFSANLSQIGPAETSLLGDLMFVGASIFWALFTVLLKRWQVRAFDVTLGVVALSALIYLPVYVLFLPKHIDIAPSGDIFLQAFFQGFVVVCCAMWTYAKAAELLGPVRVAVMMSAVPVLGTLLALPFLSETLTAGTALGAAITFIGAMLGALSRPAPAPAR